MSSRSTAARRRRANQRAGAGLSPLFLGQMRCPSGIDVARSLPAVVRLMQAAAQRSGADRDVVALLQIVPEQWTVQLGAWQTQPRGSAPRAGARRGEGGRGA